MKATREELAMCSRVFADLAMMVGAMTLDGATEAELEAIAEATAKVAHAALVLEHAFRLDGKR